MHHVFRSGLIGLLVLALPLCPAADEALTTLHVTRADGTAVTGWSLTREGRTLSLHSPGTPRPVWQRTGGWSAATLHDVRVHLSPDSRHAFLSHVYGSHSEGLHLLDLAHQTTTELDDTRLAKRIAAEWQLTGLTDVFIRYGWWDKAGTLSLTWQGHSNGAKDDLWHTGILQLSAALQWNTETAPLEGLTGLDKAAFLAVDHRARWGGGKP